MRSTKAFYTFTFLMRVGMGSVSSLYVLYLLDLGLSYSQVLTINIAYFVLIILFELPTGMLADGRGRGYSIIAGAVFTSFSGIAYFMAEGIWGALFGEALCALGVAFFSGALTAWIADAPDRKISLQHVYANRTIAEGAGTILGTFVGVYLALLTDRSFGFLVLAGGYALATLFAWIFMRGSEPEHSMSEFEALRSAVAHLRSSASMRWALGAQMASGIFGAYNLFWTPLLITKFSQAQLGWIWIIMYVSTVISGWYIRNQAKDHDGARNHLAVRTLKSLMLVALAMGLIWTIDNGIVWVVLIAFHEIGRGMFAPYLDTYVNERVPSAFRATYGSLQSFLGLFGMVIAEGAVYLVYQWVASDASTIPWLWLGASIALASAVALLYQFRPKA
ncbi:MFS transporter [Patescibacteria group bacterium]|nr:MFS transporter [Patescibacteria group bacterium]